MACAISGRLVIVCPFELRCFIGCMTFSSESGYKICFVLSAVYLLSEKSAYFVFRILFQPNMKITVLT